MTSPIELTDDAVPVQADQILKRSDDATACDAGISAHGPTTPCIAWPTSARRGIRWPQTVSLAAPFLVVGAMHVAQAHGAGPGLEDDRRAIPRPPPTSLEEVASRFLPSSSRLGDPSVASLVERESHSVTYQVSTGICYGFVGFSSTIRDLDLRVRMDGTIIAQDVVPDAFPVVSWCATRDGTVEATITAYVGAGYAQMGAWVERNSQERTAGASDDLNNRLDRFVEAVAPRGIPIGTQRRFRFNGPSVQAFELPLESGKCYSVVAVGDSRVLDLDLRVMLGEAEQARDSSTEPNAAVVTCAPYYAPHAVTVALVLGSGDVAVEVLELN